VQEQTVKQRGQVMSQKKLKVITDVDVLLASLRMRHPGPSENEKVSQRGQAMITEKKKDL